MNYELSDQVCDHWMRRISQKHAEHIRSYGSLVAVCDIIKDRADEMAA